MADIIDLDVSRKEKAILKAAARLRDGFIAQFGHRTKAIVESAEGARVIKRFVAAVRTLTNADESFETSAARVMAAHAMALEYRAAKLALDTRVVQFTRDPLGLFEYWRDE